ncbi:MAG: hypothetical protein LPK01_00325, partial [Hymenobacteraceae bacterium]|nr:hypothetical protein [Hymenobacteraceae bacterium]
MARFAEQQLHISNQNGVTPFESVSILLDGILVRFLAVSPGYHGAQQFEANPNQMIASGNLRDAINDYIATNSLNYQASVIYESASLEYYIAVKATKYDDIYNFQPPVIAGGTNISHRFTITND